MPAEAYTFRGPKLGVVFVCKDAVESNVIVRTFSFFSGLGVSSFFISDAGLSSTGFCLMTAASAFLSADSSKEASSLGGAGLAFLSSSACLSLSDSSFFALLLLRVALAYQLQSGIDFTLNRPVIGQERSKRLLSSRLNKRIDLFYIGKGFCGFLCRSVVFNQLFYLRNKLIASVHIIHNCRRHLSVRNRQRLTTRPVRNFAHRQRPADCCGNTLIVP